jgi:hypothetical protein
MMQLDVDCVIDAAEAGNISRYVNHSCDPNCELQRWQVGSEIRIGIFAKRFIPAGEELTYDYKLSAKSAFKCYCGAASCRGTLKAVSLKEMQEQLDKESRERYDAKLIAIEQAMHENGRLSGGQRNQLQALADAKISQRQRLQERAHRHEFLRTSLTGANLPGSSGQVNLVSSGPSERDFAVLRELSSKGSSAEAAMVFLPRAARRGGNLLERKEMRDSRKRQKIDNGAAGGSSSSSSSGDSGSGGDSSALPTWWPDAV